MVFRTYCTKILFSSQGDFGTRPSTASSEKVPDPDKASFCARPDGIGQL